MIPYLVASLREHPELAVFLSLAVGFLIGRIRIGSFTLGTVVGTLLAGVVIGTASDAIGRLGLPQAEQVALTNNIPVAYAVTYLIGTAFIVWFLPNIGPRLMRVNLKEEARVFISRIRRDGRIIEPESATVIREGDIIAILTRTELLMARGTEIGPEIDDKALLDFPVEILDVVVTNKSFDGKTLGDLANMDIVRGVFLKKLTRADQPMPFALQTPINRGDVMTLVGATTDVERVAKEIGYSDRPTVKTDMIFVGLGIFFGSLVGLLTVTLGGLPITLTASEGALIMGLVFVGLIVAVLPHAAAILFGRYVLKMNPLILLGACSGAGTITAALRAVQEESGSELPTLGYTVPYAIGNIVLTAWGPVLVAMMAA